MPSNPAKTVIAIPQDDVDQIIFTGTYSFQVNDVVNSYNPFTIPETFPPDSLITGLYSFDNGVTWNDPGSSVIFFNNVAKVANGWLYSYSSFNGFGIGKAEFQYTPLVVRNGGQPYQVLLKIAVSLNPKVTEYDKEISKFSGKTAYNSTQQYLRIAKKGTWLPNINDANANVVINHGLGYVPFVEVFINDRNTISVMGTIFNVFSTPQGLPMVWADETNLYIAYATNGGTQQYEVYYKIYSKG